MTPKVQKNLTILFSIIIAGTILKITSDLDNIQIGITLFSGWVVFWTSKQKKLIKYPGASIGLLVFLFLLGLAYLPLFKNKPDNTDYIITQRRHIIVNSNEDTSMIYIKQGGFTKNQEVSKKEQEIFLKESQISTINFINKNPQSNSNITIQFADQTTVVIYPNTSFSLQISGNQQILNKISGKIEYTTGQTNNTIINNAEFKKASDFAGLGLWTKYEKNQRDTILQKAGGPIMENQNVRTIVHNILVLGSKIRPKHYNPYLNNEKIYKKLLNRQDSTPQSFENNTQETASGMLNQAKQAGSKTKFLQFLSK